MSMFNKPIQEILKTYTEYVTSPKEHTAEERIDYINKQFNQLNIISKLISISSNGNTVEDQISDPITGSSRRTAVGSISSDAKTPTSIPEPVVPKTSASQAIPEEPDITPLEVIKEELNAWGVGTEYAGSKILIAITELDNPEYGEVSTDMAYDELCDVLALAANTTAAQVKTNITFVRKKANFNKAKYIPAFKRLPKSKITNELIIKEFLEFVIG